MTEAIKFLLDGDEVSISAWAPTANGVRLGFGAVSDLLRQFEPNRGPAQDLRRKAADRNRE